MIIAGYKGDFKMYKMIFINAIFFVTFLFSFGAIRVSPAEGYNFGLVTIDTQVDFTFEIKNIENYPIHICSVKLEDENKAFQKINDGCTGKSLNSYGACNFSIVFSPAQKQVYENKVRIIYDDNGNDRICDELKDYDLPLKGIGTNLRIVKIYPEPKEAKSYFSFGEINIGESATFTFRVCNAGGESISIRDIEIENLNSTLFGLDYNTCNNAYLIYAPDNENCDVNYCEFSVKIDTTLISNVSNKIVQAYVKINDLNAGPNNIPSGYKLFLSAKLNLPTETMRAPVGGEDVQLFKINFSCPNNGNETAGEIIPIGKAAYTVVGSYFYIDEQNSSCPQECIEGQTQVCNVLVKFKPEAPGVYEGKVIVSLPIREIGLFGKEYVIQQNIVGIAGDITTKFLTFSPTSISFAPVNRLNVQERILNIKNTSSAAIPFDVYPVGPGFGISKVECDCNEKYSYDSGFCIPTYKITGTTDPSQIPSSPHPYVIKPGKTCSIFTYFFQPLSLSMDKLEGNLVIETPIENFLIPLEASTSSNSKVPVYTPPPNIDIGGGSGGCNLFNISFVIGITVLLKLLRHISHYLKVFK